MLTFRGGAPSDLPTRTIIDQISGLVEVGLERELLRRAAEFSRVAMYEQAVHDPLTGLYNRIPLADAARQLAALDDRDTHGQLAAFMIDVDHFKAVNDTYGHQTGDKVLRHVADAINQSVRAGDMAFRYGGEEFLVLLSSVDENAVTEIAERIRATIAQPAAGRPTVTASIGVAFRRDLDQAALVDRADKALYEAKRDGRDRIRIAP